MYPLAVCGLGQLPSSRIKANGSLVKKDGTADHRRHAGRRALRADRPELFRRAGYFHPRPSAAGPGYDATNSGGTNLGPLSDKLINGLTNAATTQPTTLPETLAFDGVRLRTIHYANDNGIPFKLYMVDANGNKTAVPLSKYEDSQGNLNDVALVDAFPHMVYDGLVAGDFATLIPGDAVTGSASGLDPHISPKNADLQAHAVANARNVSVDKVKAVVAAYTDGPSLGFLGDPGVNVLRVNLALDAQYPILRLTGHAARRDHAAVPAH